MDSNTDSRPFDAVLAEFARRWDQGSIRVETSASEKQITDFERRYDVVIPDDLRRFLIHVGGMKELLYDEEFYHFNSLPEIAPVTSVLPSLSSSEYEGYFSLCDYSICAYFWALRMTNERSDPAPVVFVREGPKRAGDLISASFREFLTNYLCDWKLIWPSD